VAFVALLGAVGILIATSGTTAAPREGRPAQDHPGPVLLVPGYGGGKDALNVLAGRIRATGREAGVLTLAGDGTGDLLEQVGVLADAAERAYERGAPSVDVIGYSAGGVVARLWVTQQGAHQARRVVTLGAPMHGTNLATTGGVLAPSACPTACRQLTPGSPLLRQLDRQPLPADLPWLSVWTENDETVTPPDSARLDGAVNVPLQGVCPADHAGHGDLPTDRAVTGLVLRALGTGPLETPRPEDCAALSS
jgi:hypothetical protein